METTSTPKKKKKKSGIVAYFTPFGLRQITDLLMIVGAVMIFVGLFVHSFLAVSAVVIIGLSMYILACGIAIFRCVKVLLSKDLSRKSKEFKNAVVNICVMAVILGLSILGVVAAANGW